MLRVGGSFESAGLVIWWSLLFTLSSIGRSGGIVRLIQRQLAERALIKGYRGSVLDIAFASSDIHVLASLDDSGTLFVHRIELDDANRVMYPYSSSS